MTKILESCPACGGDLEIREVHCRQCGTEIRSHFDPCPFCRLTVDQIRFLEMFVQVKGNMRMMEQLLGVSYPTVRSRVEAIATRLASRPDATVVAPPGGAGRADAAPEQERPDEVAARGTPARAGRGRTARAGE